MSCCDTRKKDGRLLGLFPASSSLSRGPKSHTCVLRTEERSTPIQPMGGAVFNPALPFCTHSFIFFLFHFPPAGDYERATLVRNSCHRVSTDAPSQIRLTSQCAIRDTPLEGPRLCKQTAGGGTSCARSLGGYARLRSQRGARKQGTASLAL